MRRHLLTCLGLLAGLVLPLAAQEPGEPVPCTKAAKLELLGELRALRDERPARDDAYPFVLAAGERRTSTANTAARSALSPTSAEPVRTRESRPPIPRTTANTIVRSSASTSFASRSRSRAFSAVKSAVDPAHPQGSMRRQS